MRAFVTRARQKASIIPRIGQPATTCPANPGARGWPATAYNPRTGILYMPLNEFCATMTATPINPGQAYSGGGAATFKFMAMPNSDGNFGRVDAVRLADQSTVWSHRQRAPSTSAVLPTGGARLGTEAAPWRFDSFLPSGPCSRGRCAYSGGLASRASTTSSCLGVFDR